MKTGTVKMKKRIWALMLSAVIAVTFMPCYAFADSGLTETAPGSDAFGTSKAETATTEVSLRDSDDLLMQYLEVGVSGHAPLLRSKRRDTLTSNEKGIYDALKTKIEDLAAGRRSSSVLQVSYKDMLGSKMFKIDGYWAISSETLGVDAIVVNGSVTPEALQAYSELTEYSWTRVIDALLYDLPYDFYWFDKTMTYRCDVYSNPMAGSYNDSGVIREVVYFPDDPVIQFTLHIASAYRATGTDGTTTANTQKTAATRTCISTVNSIVRANESKSAVQKLYAYKNIICGLTEYNKAAASAGGYGDPWQLIWVFDNDPGTTVVCEGYSKAFQFLCDNSELGTVECHTVTGDLVYHGSAEPHMWNILHMYDGNNYLADVTNCDFGTAEESSDILFLEGKVSGSVSAGYTFDPLSDSSNQFLYKYDNDTLSLYTDAELKITSKGQEAYLWDCTHSDKSIKYTWSANHLSVMGKWTCRTDGYTERETVSATVITEVPAACEKSGSITYKSHGFSNPVFKTQTVTVPTKALGHYPAKVAAKPATKDKAGHREYWKCTRCGKLFADASGRKAIAKEDTVVSWNDWTGEDGTPLGKGSSSAAAEKAIKKLTGEKDPAGSAFCPLKLRSVKQGNTSIRLTWKKVSGAKRYIIYGCECGKKNKPVRIGATKKSSYDVKKIRSKLKKGTYHKFIVVALDKKGYVVSTSKLIHVATKGKANYTGVTTKAKKNRVSLKKGKTFKLGAKAVGKNVKQHVGVRYESSDPKVAKVSKSGKIKALKKGSCKIYVYTQNGICKTIKVTVR